MNNSKVTILGAGITGMAIASQMPKGCDITIVARNLPGDPDSLEWASPWAGAVWMSKLPSDEWEQKMQLEAFYGWWKLAYTYPESSVRRIDMWDIVDTVPQDQIWYMNKLPNFRVLTKEELPEGAPFGMAYTSIVVTPSIFLPWMRKRLEASGVKFQRMNISSLADLEGLGHDVLINASGVGARHLKDCADVKMLPVRGQTVLVKTNLDKIWIRRGLKDYTYALPRLDGTAILGGIKQHGSTETAVNTDLRAEIFRRINEQIPWAFPSADPQDFEVVRDIVGLRPETPIVRIEKESIGGQKVVHAYGHQGMYILSWGMAREACRLVQELLDQAPGVGAMQMSKL
ncbi:hypothetical protein LTR85_010717 [Meristemomyces frigidus]|nr:hypothetical protein LTR85_010717 [Meristemomyces frigidus]